jgi:hypothetical protein
MDSKKLHILVDTFKALDINISEFITQLISTPSLQNSSLVQYLRTNGAVIAFTINAAFPFASAPILDVAFQRICDYLKDETQKLISQSEKHGWQFGAVHAQAEQFKRFRVDEMARQMAAISPRFWHFLWHFLCSLLSSKYTAEDVNISDLDDLEVSEAQDLGGMIQQLVDSEDSDKPTREARNIANENLTAIFKIVDVSKISSMCAFVCSKQP